MSTLCRRVGLVWRLRGMSLFKSGCGVPGVMGFWVGRGGGLGEWKGEKRIGCGPFRGG